MRELEDKVVYWEKFNKYLVEYNRPSDQERDAVKDLIDMKLVRDGLKAELKELKAAKKERDMKYDEAWY